MLSRCYRFHELTFRNQKAEFTKLSDQELNLELECLERLKVLAQRYEVVFRQNCIEHYRKTIDGETPTLGDSLRYDPELPLMWGGVSGWNLVKATENQRAFMKLWLDAVVASEQRKLLFFCLERDFLVDAHIVDSSSINCDKAFASLTNFFSVFSMKRDAVDRVVFAEMVRYPEIDVKRNVDGNLFYEEIQ